MPPCGAVQYGAALVTRRSTPPIFTSGLIVIHSAVTIFSPHRHDDPVACRRGRATSRRDLEDGGDSEESRPACRAGV